MAIVQVPVVKGKGSVDIDIEKLPDDMYKAALEAGLKVLINGGASKITKAEYPDEAELKAAAMAKAEERVAQMLDGTLKLPGVKAAKKASGAVMTEARRLAKAIILDLMRKQGIRKADVDAKEITAAANELIEQQPDILEEAKANIEAREKSEVAGKIDISALIKINPTKKAKNDAENAAKKAERAKNKPLSAKQAGMTAKAKKKPAAQAQA